MQFTGQSSEFESTVSRVMRVRFFEPSSEREAELRLGTERRIRSFWETYETLSRSSAASPQLSDALTAVHPELELRMHRGISVVRANGDRGLEPLVEWILELAPRRLQHQFRAGLEPRETDQVVTEIAQTSGHDFGRAEVRVGVGRGHLLEVVLLVPKLEDPASAWWASEQLVRYVLGDAVFHHWIGSVKVSPAASRGPLQVLNSDRSAASPSFPIAMLASLVDTARRGIVSGLNEHPDHAWCERASWTMLESEGTTDFDGGDYQSDLIMKSTMKPEAAKCYLDGEPFSSQRFSRCGETHCYLKYRCPADALDERLRRRAELEDRLNYALIPTQLGCVVGAGIGERFDYIDLSLAELEHGLRVTRDTLRTADCPKPAWVLFCDTAWLHEWLDVHPGQPPPPSRADSSAAPEL